VWQSTYRADSRPQWPVQTQVTLTTIGALEHPMSDYELQL